MKIGSIVECVSVKLRRTPQEGEIYPRLWQILTVRGVDYNGLVFEEIHNRPRLYNQGYCELHFSIDRFREIQFPPSLESEIQ